MLLHNETRIKAFQMETEKSLQRHYDVQAAFTGSASQTGPLVEPCREILGMEFSAFHGTMKTLEKHRCTHLPNCRATFLDPQINGAVFMLQRTFGHVPLPPEHSENETMMNLQRKLRGLPTHGGIIVDATGLGKTFLTLLYLSYVAAFNPWTEHKPMLILTPSAIILSQWHDAMLKEFPDLTVIVAHGETTDVYKSRHWVSAAAMRDAPRRLRHWPAKLEYIFDPNKPAASRTIVLSTYDTFTARTLVETEIPQEGKKPETVYSSKWSGIFRVVILDEGHELRHPWTKSYHAVKNLNADIHWFLTATPVINGSVVSDLHTLMKISDLTSFRISLGP